MNRLRTREIHIRNYMLVFLWGPFTAQLRIYNDSYVEPVREAAITLNVSVAIQKFYSLNFLFVVLASSKYEKNKMKWKLLSR
jgi:hypothetical protein